MSTRMPSDRPTLNEPPALERYLEPGSVTAQLYDAAKGMIPGGTSRLHYLFEPYPIYARSGRGCRLTDVDGDERIDCLNNMTSLIHGHCDPDINAAVVEQLQRGISFSEPSEPEIELARLMIDRVPTVERIHFRSSGTEAVMIAVKLAREFTGRTRIAKFEGAYHGYYDYVQVGFSSTPGNWGQAAQPASTPSSGGLSGSVTNETLVLPFNDEAAVEALLERHGSELAAVLVEPLANRSGMVLPKAGFFDFLREITRQHGILLIFDEVVSFRTGPAGAQGRYGGAPDLTTFGKIIGGGLPIGAIGGQAGVMELLNPKSQHGNVISGGTYSGNPLSAAAGVAALSKLTPETLERLDGLGERARHGINEILNRAGVRARATGDSSLFQLVPTLDAIDNYRSVPTDETANAFLARLHQRLLATGLIVSQRGLSCLSTPMDEAVVDECLDAVERAVAQMADD